MRLAVSGGQPLFTLELPMFALTLEYFLCLLWGPSTSIDFFYWCQEYHSNSRNKIYKGRTWGLSDKYWLSWKRLSFDVLFSCHFEISLFHRGRVTHICVRKLTIIGSDNGLSPGRRQAIIWTNAGILLTGALATNFNETSIEIHTFSFKKIHLNCRLENGGHLSRSQCVQSDLCLLRF